MILGGCGSRLVHKIVTTNLWKSERPIYQRVRESENQRVFPPFGQDLTKIWSTLFWPGLPLKYFSQPPPFRPTHSFYAFLQPTIPEYLWPPSLVFDSLVMWTCRIRWQAKTISGYHSGYGHHNLQDGDLPWTAPTHKVTWQFNNLVLKDPVIK